ncbi:MAG: hypothetical protein U5R48_12580 [Gammaproteobacteria bacterium]|nr:hypothetical protein [Gammaproteobacteria bacterium]
MALNNGIAHARDQSPVQLFDRRNGLLGSVSDILRHTDGRLYATTEQGLFRLKPAGDGQPARFEQLASGERWSLASAGDSLLVFNLSGLSYFDGTRLRFLSRDAGGHIMRRSTATPWRLHLGTNGYRTVDLRQRPWR